MATSAIQIDPQTGERLQRGPQIDPQTGERISPPTTPSSPQPSMGQQALGVAKDVGKGLLEGAGSTASNIGSLIYPHWLERKLTGKDSSQAEQKLFAPANSTQAISKGAEQAAEFMVPGGAEEAGAEKLASLVPKAGKVLPRLLASGVGSGLVNKAQGGGFGTGAAAGVAGAGIGAGLNAAAPKLAEAALGIPKAARAFGRTPGKAIIEETQGIRPETVARTAQESLGRLNPELESKYAASPNTMSLLPARQHIANQMMKAEGENAEGLHGQLNRMGNTLAERFGTKQAIPQDVPALRG